MNSLLHFKKTLFPVCYWYFVVVVVVHNLKRIPPHVVVFFLFLFLCVLQTDTASVLSEAIGYVRFLHNQIEVKFYTYLTSSSFFILLHFSEYNNASSSSSSSKLWFLFHFFSLFIFQALISPYLGNNSSEPTRTDELVSVFYPKPTWNFSITKYRSP